MIRTLGRRQRLAAATALVVFAAGLIALAAQSDQYESSGTYVVRAESAEQNDTLRALATLSDASKISATFNLVAESDLIEARAVEAATALGIDVDADYEISANVNPGTNILTISVLSDRPEVAEALASAVGVETGRFVEEAGGGVFELAAIDAPTTPNSPVGNGGPLWVAILLVVAAAAGVCAALLAEARSQRRGGRWDIDDFTTRVEDEAYTSRRLDEEKARSDDTGAPFSVAVMTVGVDGAKADAGKSAPDIAELPLVVRAIGETLRPHDHLARLDETGAGTFAAIMPDLSFADLDEVTEYWPDIVAEALGDNPDVEVEITRCRYERGRFRGDAPATKVVSSL